MFTLSVFLCASESWTIRMEETSRNIDAAIKCMGWSAKYALKQIEY
jgi:hypothetical protein